MKLTAVEELVLENATTDTIQAKWLLTKGATGYRLTWGSYGIVPLNYVLESMKYSFTFQSLIILSIVELSDKGP